MSDSRRKPGVKPLGVVQYPALLWPHQLKAIRDAGPRKGNAYLRDLIDFGLEHQSLFFAWLTARGESAAPGQEQPQ